MLGKLRRKMAKKISETKNVNGELDKQQYISRSIEKNIDYIQTITRNIPELVYREIKSLPEKCYIIFLQNISNQQQIENHIIAPILRSRKEDNNPTNILIEKLVEISDYNKTDRMDDLFGSLMSGETIILIDRLDYCYSYNTVSLPHRQISQPSTENVIRGPQNGFVEDISVNMGMMRSMCKDPNLKFEHFKIGRRTKADIVLMYMAGVAKEDLVAEVHKRIKDIDVDKTLDSGELEEYLEDNANSPFPQLKATERPDRAIADILEGKVGIIISNSPFCIIGPASLHMQLASAEDYYEKWIIGSIIRASRYAALFLSMALPSIYIALISFNVGLLPRDFLVAIASARQGIPFPAFIEVLLMEVGLEFLHEASVRLPKSVGQTVGVVGGLILGEAAVNAGLVSSAMVIVIALTAISSFIIPSYPLMLATRIVRIPLMIVSSIFGLYGLVMGLLIISIHIVDLTSFNENYLAPWGQYGLSALKDTLIRAPLKSIKKRPEYLGPEDPQKSKKSKSKWW